MVSGVCSNVKEIMAKAKVKIQKENESCVIVGVSHSNITEEVAIEHLEELEFLATTAGASTTKHFLQKLPVPNPKTYVGSGKLEEIKEYINVNNIELVIFDDELSPSQLRNIEKELQCKILDRTILILDIFAKVRYSNHSSTKATNNKYNSLY